MNWISVKDRLPTSEEGFKQTFIVTVEVDFLGNILREIHYDIDYHDGNWYVYSSEDEEDILLEEDDTIKVVAWAFSPEPYQGE